MSHCGGSSWLIKKLCVMCVSDSQSVNYGFYFSIKFGVYRLVLFFFFSVELGVKISPVGVPFIIYVRVNYVFSRQSMRCNLWL